MYIYLVWLIRRPLSSVFCPSADGSRWERFKYLFTASCHLYGLILFYLLINPVVAWIAAATDIIVLVVGSFLLTPVLYAIGGHAWFNKKQMCWGSYNSDSGRCNGFAWNSNPSKIFLAFLIGLVLMPIALRMCIYMAKFAKSVTYWFAGDKIYGGAYSDENTALLSLQQQQSGVGADAATVGVNVNSSAAEVHAADAPVIASVHHGTTV